VAQEEERVWFSDIADLKPTWVARPTLLHASHKYTLQIVMEWHMSAAVVVRL
jgi:hypothetical protein